MSAAGILAFLEAAIILGAVTLWYNAVLIFAATFTGLMTLEGLLTYFTRLVFSDRGASRSTPA